MADEINLKRAYVTSDSTMLSKVRTIHSLFVKDLDAFAAFDATFSPEWGAAWLADIDAAVSVTDDSIRRAEMMGETEDLTDVIEEARTKWIEIKYFIKKAWPGDRAMLHLFGASAYKAARMNQPKMAEFLLGLHSTATDYAASLIEAGYTQARIDEIQTICEALLQKNDAQNKARRGRPKLTAQRIAALNAPYTRLMRVNRAAQIVFMNDYAKRKQYVFLARRKRKKKDDKGEG